MVRSAQGSGVLASWRPLAPPSPSSQPSSHSHPAASSLTALDVERSGCCIHLRLAFPDRFYLKPQMLEQLMTNSFWMFLARRTWGLCMTCHTAISMPRTVNDDFFMNVPGKKDLRFLYDMLYNDNRPRTTPRQSKYLNPSWTQGGKTYSKLVSRLIRCF